MGTRMTPAPRPPTSSLLPPPSSSPSSIATHQILVFGDAQNQWSLSRPLLALILAAELQRPDVRPGWADVGGGCRTRRRAPNTRAPASPHSAPRPSLLHLPRARPQCFDAFKVELIASQPSDARGRMGDELAKLMGGITRSLDVANRERFAQRLTVFRIAVREFATA